MGLLDYPCLVDGSPFLECAIFDAGIVTVRDLVSRDDNDLLKITNFGKKALAEVKDHLEGLGLSLGMRFDLPRG